MNFKEWLQTEMAHLVVNPPVVIGDKEVNFIDMQFELYPGLTHEQLADWMLNGFAAPVPDSSYWLVFDGKTAKARLMKSPDGKAELPEWWWKKAFLSDETL